MTAPSPARGAGPGTALLPDDGSLLHTARRGRRLAEVLPGVAAALGVEVDGGLAARSRLGLPSATRACVVLVDGLGYENLADRAGHAPFLRQLAAGTPPLTTTFPSTTATAMTTFGTGLPPGRTKMLGYTVRNPATGRLGNLVSWTDLPPAQEWQPAPSVLGLLAEAGVPTTSVGPARFAGSGLTLAALRGARYRPAERLAERVDAVRDALRTPGLAHLYWGDVDKVGHHEGVGSRQWGDALGEVDTELARLARTLPTGTLLVITADHGMVDADPALRWDVGGDPVLGADVELVAGEARALHLTLTAGADVEAARGRWCDVLGAHAVVVTRDEAVADNWFGPVSPDVLPVIGDLVVEMRGRATVVDSRTQSPGAIALVGVHGSLSRAEMLVPCLMTVC